MHSGFAPYTTKISKYESLEGDNQKDSPEALDIGSFPSTSSLDSQKSDKNLQGLRIKKKISLLSFFRCVSKKKKTCPSSLFLLGPQKPHCMGRKTLVLDLDETLVHSKFSPVNDADHKFFITFDDSPVLVSMMVRPGAQEFIIKMSKIYEIVIFTASRPEYALPVISYLDPLNVVSYALFREDCTNNQGSFVKDLSKLGRDLKDIVIIDNSAVAFSLQPQNAFHIKNFFDNKDDRELYKLIPFLEYLAHAQDVRRVKDWKIRFDLKLRQEEALMKLLELQNPSSSDNLVGTDALPTADDPVKPEPIIILSPNLDTKNTLEIKMKYETEEINSNRAFTDCDLACTSKRMASENLKHSYPIFKNSASKKNHFASATELHLNICESRSELEASEISEMEARGKQTDTIKYSLEYGATHSQMNFKINFNRELLIESAE